MHANYLDYLADSRGLIDHEQILIEILKHMVVKFLIF